MPSDITIIDPYDGLFFEHEQKAYAYFTANTGIAGVTASFCPLSCFRMRRLYPAIPVLAVK